jgi:glycerol dehydrogenase-like iron-containing ADH family enzyme
MCLDPLYNYGAQAVEDNRRHVVSNAFEEVVLSIVITSGLVSNFAAPEYNGHMAHRLFVELADLPAAEQCRQHGGLVAYGTLLLLLCDGQKEEFERFFRFCRSIGLPTCREDTCASEADIHRVFQATEKKQDVSVMPYKITQDMLHAAARDLEAYHAQQDKPEKILGKK